MKAAASISFGALAGGAALAFIFIVIAGAFAALGFVAVESPVQSGVFADPYTWKIVRFTLWQAALSTLLSLAFALPGARAIARQDRFFGRTFLLRLFALPLALPALVVVLGVIGVWGKQGWVMVVTQIFGFEFSVFGLSGILLAHVFFNMPLALRLLLARLESVPVETWRLAAQLDLTPFAIFRLVEWPMLRSALAGVAGLVFMLCLASFAVVLTLGGGPKSTTIEVAIYQALRFDFDPGRAVNLAFLQLSLTIILLMALKRFMAVTPLNPPLRLLRARLDGRGMRQRVFDAAIILMASGFILMPLAALIGDGLSADLARLLSEKSVLRAISTSLIIAAMAATLCHLIVWPLIKAAQTRGGLFAGVSDLSASAILVMPPVVLGAGWFVLLHRWGSVFSLSAIVVVVINALMAMPFVYRILAPALAEAASATDRLCASLNIHGLARFRLVDWPMLRRPLALSMGFAMALSLGDLGVIALFGSQDLVTMPLLLLQRMGAYRTMDAAGLALILGALCLALVYGSEKLFRGVRHA